jgi:GNAT superfamily N-acetyltransferase
MMFAMSPTAEWRVEPKVGAAMLPYLDDLARLRIAVFREWPYLYEGDRDYERTYLAAYARSPSSVCVLAFAGDEIVGASTGVPLAHDSVSFHQAFVERGIAVDDVFYFGESVLLQAWRGRGIGHRFFDEREAHARRAGFRLAAFCSVIRDAGDPRCPTDYHGNEVFWRKRGYASAGDMACEIDWKEPGDEVPRRHRLGFWMRALESQG